MLTDYTHTEEGLRIVDTGTMKYKIVLNRGNGLWNVQVDTGSVPVALRGSYTAAHVAFTAIKNYIDGFKDRQIIYSNKKPKNKEE